jgi:hypothetical protein
MADDHNGKPSVLRKHWATLAFDQTSLSARSKAISVPDSVHAIGGPLAQPARATADGCMNKETKELPRTGTKICAA